MSTGSSIFLYLLFEQERSYDLLNLFWRKVNENKYIIFRVLLVIDFLMIFSLFLNLLGIQMPFISHGRASEAYLSSNYRYPALLGVIGSQGSVAYTSYSLFIFTISDLFLGYRKIIVYLSIILMLILAFLSGGSGIIFILIFYSLFLIMKLIRLIYSLKITKNAFNIIIFNSTILFSIILYTLNGNKTFGFDKIARLYIAPDRFLTRGTSGYLIRGFKDFPIYVKDSLNEILNNGFDSILFGIKTNLSLPAMTDYGLPNLLLLYGVPLTLIYIFYFSELIIKSIVDYSKNILIENKISFLICLKLALVLFMMLYSYKEPVFFNTPCLLPLFYLLDSSIKFRKSLNNKY